MDAIVLLVVVALVSLLITRVATVALTVTGMTQPMARFQARSALSGVGFTTSESEAVVSHPVRRRIVMALMLVGNVGLVTAVAGLLGGFLRADASESALRVALLVAGLASVHWLSKSSFVDRHLSRFIGRLLSRYTELDVADADRLLHLSGPYSIEEVPVQEDTWLAGRTLGELRLRDEGIVVLGIGRDGEYLGAPDGDTQLHVGETLIVYGRDTALARIAGRPVGDAGDRSHEEGARTHRRLRDEELAATGRAHAGAPSSPGG
jgi:K+/H+ antiporter YhaU regulatory subunit KhtT